MNKDRLSAFTDAILAKKKYKEKEVTGAIKGMQIAGMSDNEIMTKIIENFNVTKEYVLALLTPQKA